MPPVRHSRRDEPPAPPVHLFGLDVGSTTSSAMIATVRIGRSAISGRMTLGAPAIVSRAEPVFTPFRGDDIDEVGLSELIDGWIGRSGLGPADFFAAGAIVTGLAARRPNAAALSHILRARVGEAVLAAAGDARLESWLAFMGSCSNLSRRNPSTPVLNLDIGGGTTNSALGIAGAVQATGCHFIGARHLQFIPGGYRIAALSEFAIALLAELGIHKGVGDVLEEAEREAVLGYYVAGLEAIVAGASGFFDTPAGRPIEQVRFAHEAAALAALTYSGGVGELLYRLHAGGELPGTTHYGDLGIDLARAIAASPVLSRSLSAATPENGGRATVYGIALHGAEVSGTSLYLPRPGVLPLRDLPVVSRLGVDASERDLAAAIALARASVDGACLQISAPDPIGSGVVRALGRKLAAALRSPAFPPGQPLLILFERNAGHALGNYATEWGRLPVDLIVIDEVPVRGAHFVNIGTPRQQVVPVSYYGMG